MPAPFGDDLDPGSTLVNENGMQSLVRSQSDELSPRPRWIDEDERPSLADQEKNRHFFRDRPYLLMLVRPCIEGFSLKLNQWCKFLQ